MIPKACHGDTCVRFEKREERASGTGDDFPGPGDSMLKYERQRRMSLSDDFFPSSDIKAVITPFETAEPNFLVSFFSIFAIT